MTQELRLKTHHNPSIFNKDMVLGGLLGLWCSLIPIPGAMIIGALVGGGIGGLMGKSRLERENREGKRVGESSFWNKDTLIGGLLGNGLGLLFGSLAGGAILLAGFTAAGIDLTSISTSMTHEATEELAHQFTEKAPGYGLAAVGALFGSWIGGTVIGTWVGGKHGQKTQELEYEEAKQQQIVQHVGQAMSPEMAKGMEYALEHKKEWANGVVEDRLLATAQQAVR